MIRIYTPGFADKSNTNAQNLTIKEVVSRLPPEKFHVTINHSGEPDPRIASRLNTRLIQWKRHGNTARVMARLLLHPPDIYFFPSFGPLDAAYLQMRDLLRLRTAGLAYVVGNAGLAPLPPTMERWVRSSDVVMAVSAFAAECAQKHLGVQAGVIHDGVDARYFFPPDNPVRKGPLVVLYAGSFQKYKRPEIVVQQAARQPDVLFRMAGQGPLLESCKALAASLGCQNITFAGHLSSSDLGEEMRRASLFLFPSIIEGHPQVLGQAAASGLPCIAMEIYRPDYVVHNTTGFLVSSDAELAARLDTLLDDASLRQSMSLAAAEHSKLFDWDKIAGQWANAMERVAHGRRSSRRSGAMNPAPRIR